MSISCEIRCVMYRVLIRLSFKIIESHGYLSTHVGLIIWTGHTKNQLQLLSIETGAHLAHQCISASPFSILDGAM